MKSRAVAEPGGDIAVAGQAQIADRQSAEADHHPDRLRTCSASCRRCPLKLDVLAGAIAVMFSY